jgi:hypothetical protein
MTVVLLAPILNERNDLQDPSINFVLELGKVHALLLEERDGFRVVEELVHMAVKIVIVLISRRMTING